MENENHLNATIFLLIAVIIMLTNVPRALVKEFKDIKVLSESVKS